MNRKLLPTWQFLLLSGIRRGVWAADPDYMSQEHEFALRLLRGEAIPQFASLPDEIAFNTESPDDDNELRCAIIPIIGTMLRYGTLCSYGADEYASMLYEALNDASISSVVLQIDSGGGDARSVAPIYEAICAVKTVKPIIASIDTACSAAYWVASACDNIFAQNAITSVAGSIGTYTEIIDDTEYLQKDGFKRHTIYAPVSVDKNKGYRDALDGDYSTFEREVLTPLNNTFIAGVKSNRPNVNDAVFTGKTYFAPEAESLGLIDGVKSLYEVVTIANNLAVIRNFTNSK